MPGPGKLSCAMDDLAFYNRAGLVIMLVRPNAKRTVGKWTASSPSASESRSHLRRGGNFSVRTGLGPVQLAVVDLDISARANGIDSLLDFMKEEGADFDVFESVAQLADDTGAPCVKSPHGYHLYFSGETRCHTDILPGVDIKGGGGMIMIPPSKVDGIRYRWLNPEARFRMARGALPPFPHWLTLLLSLRASFGHRAQASVGPTGRDRPDWPAIKSALLRQPDFPLRGSFSCQYRFSPSTPWLCPTCDRTHYRDNLFLVYRFAEAGSTTVALRCFKRPSSDAFTFRVDQQQPRAGVQSHGENGRGEDDCAAPAPSPVA